MKKTRKYFSIFMVVVMMGSLLFGCSAPTTKPVVEIAEPPKDTTEGPKEPSSEFLIWNIGDEPGSWDPQLCGTVDGNHIIGNMFEGLMTETPDGLEYGAAESYETSANAEGIEGTVYTFKLKKGLKWSDGKPLVAQDFVNSWIRAIDPETASSYAFLLSDYIVGAIEFYNGTGVKEDIKASAPDDLTIVVELKQAVPYFLNLTAFGTYMPTRKDITDPSDIAMVEFESETKASGDEEAIFTDGWEKFTETAMSNGPFKMTEYVIGSHILLEKNENYWDADNIKLAGIKCLMLAEPNTALQGYVAGDIQVLSKVPQEEVPRLIAEDPNFNTAPALNTMFYAFNVDVEPTNDVNVRKALTLAIDRKQIVEQVLRGGEVPASGYVAPSFSKSDNSSFRILDSNGLVTEEFDIDPWKVNIVKAQEYLAAAGYPNGEGFPETELLYNVNDNDKKVAEAIQQMWKENLGIDVKLRSEEWRVFTSSRYEGNFVIGRGGWTGDYNDPMTMFDLYTSYGINYSQWRWQPYNDRESDTTLNPSNEAFEKELKQAMVTSGTIRDQHLANAEKIIMDEAVLAPLYYAANNYIVDNMKVDGVERSAMGLWIFKYAELLD